MACCRLYSDLDRIDREKEEEGKEVENQSDDAVDAELMVSLGRETKKNASRILFRERDNEHLKFPTGSGRRKGETR